MAEEFLDLRGLACPIPVLKANKAIRILKQNDIVICQITDPAAPNDFKEFCDSTGHSLLSCKKSKGSWVIKIKKT